MAFDQLPTGWQVKKLSEFVDFRNGKPIKPGQEGLFPAYGSAGIIGRASDFLYEDGIILGRVGAYWRLIPLTQGRQSIA